MSEEVQPQVVKIKKRVTYSEQNKDEDDDNEPLFGQESIASETVESKQQVIQKIMKASTMSSQM